MGRPKSKGAYVPLGAQYYMDDAVLEAGPDAELLFVRMLSFLASVSTDGFITERQVTLVAAGLRAPKRRVDRLLDVGLIEVVSGGFHVRSWLKWNRSADQVGKFLAKDRERKARKYGEDPQNSERNPDGFHLDSRLQSSTEQSSTEEANASSSKAAEAALRHDVERLLDVLDQEIASNGGRIGPRLKRNRDAVRLMLDRDGRSPDQIEAAIRWCQRDQFWRSNILSASKLREKYEQLRLAATREPNRTFGQQKQENTLALVAAYEREEAGNAEVGDSEVAHVRAIGSGW